MSLIMSDIQIDKYRSFKRLSKTNQKSCYLVVGRKSGKRSCISMWVMQMSSRMTCQPPPPLLHSSISVICKMQMVWIYSVDGKKWYFLMCTVKLELLRSWVNMFVATYNPNLLILVGFFFLFCFNMVFSTLFPCLITDSFCCVDSPV